MTPTNKQPYFGNNPNPVSVTGDLLAAPFYGAVGVGDYLTHLTSGLGARPTSQLMGLSANLQDRLSGTTDPQAGNYQQEMQDKLTYEPRTNVGKALQESPYNPINVIGKVLHKASDWAGSFGDDVGADTPVGALSNAVREATLHAAAIFGAKYTGKASRTQELIDDAAAIKVRNQNLSVTEQAIENAKSSGFTVPPIKGIGRQIAGTVKTNPVASRHNTVRATELIAEELGLKVTPKLERNIAGRVKKQDVTGKDKWTGGIDIDALHSLRSQHNAVYAEVVDTLINPKKGVRVNNVRISKQYREVMLENYNKLKIYTNELSELSKRKYDTVLGDLLKESNRRTIAPEALLDMIKANRSNASSQFRKGGAHNLKKAESDLMIANNLEKVMSEQLRVVSKKPELAKKWENSRKKLSQINVAESALNPKTGLIDPKVIAKINAKKPNYLSGNFKSVGDFAMAFPELNKYFATSPTRIGFFDTVVAGFSLASGHAGWAVAEFTGRSMIPSLMVGKGKVGLRNEPTLSLKSKYRSPYAVGQAAAYQADGDEISKFNDKALGRITKEEDKMPINQANANAIMNSKLIYND